MRAVDHLGDELRQKMVEQANKAYDTTYGLNYDKIGWKSGFVKASPRLDRESIWDFHRRLDAERQAAMNSALETSDE